MFPSNMAPLLSVSNSEEGSSISFRNLDNHIQWCDLNARQCENLDAYVLVIAVIVVIVIVIVSVIVAVIIFDIDILPILRLGLISLRNNF
jgi:hypothetical protein